MEDLYGFLFIFGWFLIGFITIVLIITRIFKEDVKGLNEAFVIMGTLAGVAVPIILLLFTFLYLMKKIFKKPLKNFLKAKK